MAFFLERVIFGCLAEQFQRGRLHFPKLPGGGGRDQFPAHFHRGTSVHFRNRLVAGDPRVGDDLEVSEAGAVVELEEGKRLGVPAGAHPACDVEVIGGFGAFEDVLDKRSHGLG